MHPSPILIVDDSEFERGLLVKVLARKGFRTIEASSGAQCLEIIATTAVGLILLDIMMPGSSGAQVLSKVREKFSPIELPIIMITAKADVSDIVGSLQSGANDYITKPIHFEIAACRISTHLKLVELSYEMARLKQRTALDAMVATYSHEINNPLAIAMGYLDIPDWGEVSNGEKIRAALWRIADIVKKIGEVTQKKEVEYQGYGGVSKTIKY
ncbi:response regulator [Bdellovibrionota bacterium FG-1]